MLATRHDDDDDIYRCIYINIHCIYLYLSLFIALYIYKYMTLYIYFPSRPGFNPRSSHIKDSKMVLETCFLT